MKKIYLLIALALLSSATLAGVNHIESSQNYDYVIAGEEDLPPWLG